VLDTGNSATYRRCMGSDHDRDHDRQGSLDVQQAPFTGGIAFAESQAVEYLLLDLLEWIGPSGRPYGEVLDAWRTSCPRLPVWEEARGRGFVTLRYDPARDGRVEVSKIGRAHLRSQRP
jgi:hypothetical protein